MIIFDLEWNRGYDSTPLNEILQIGAVRIDRLGGPVLDTFNVYIKPSVHRSYDPGAKQLPELLMSQDSETDFAAAIERFRTWCGDETEYASWGGDDLAAINQSCEYWNVPAFTMAKVYNFQTAFAYLLDAGQQIALWRAAEYCGIPDTFTFHNALNDAMYTALLSRWLTQEALDYKPVPVRRTRTVKRKVPLRLSKHAFSKPPRQTIGPFQTAEMLLDGPSSRKPACPVCGQKGCINQWYLEPPHAGPSRKGFSVFSCTEHGRFLYRLVLTRLENGLWRGRLTIPVIQPELIQEYTAVCQGSVYHCRSSGKNRRRPKRRSRRK